MTWTAHGKREIAFEKLTRAIIKVVQKKYPHLTDNEALEHFIKSMKDKKP
jgi:hypothetical protein